MVTIISYLLNNIFVSVSLQLNAIFAITSLSQGVQYAFRTKKKLAPLGLQNLSYNGIIFSNNKGHSDTKLDSVILP